MVETIQEPSNVVIKTNKDVEQYFWDSLEDFKQRFFGDNFVFLLLSCKKYESSFPDKINKKNSYETEIDQLVSIYENYFKVNIKSRLWIDSKDYQKLFNLVKDISNNKHALTFIYNHYENLVWEYIAINNRQNEISIYITDNIVQCMKNNLWILFWEENEIIIDKESKEELANRIESLSSIVRDTLYKQLKIIDEEKDYTNSIISKSIESILDKLIDIEEIDKNSTRIIKKL